MIAISYRREDSLPIAGRLYDRLQAKFGKQNVFMDFDSIPPGVDFREQIKKTIERSNLVVAVIGPHWLGEQTDGSRRIDDPTDFVRLEIEYALKRAIPVIPLLVNNTPMPKPERLPTEIKALAFRNALPLESGLDFHSHADRLINGICSLIDVEELDGKARSKIFGSVAATFLTVAGTAAGVILASSVLHGIRYDTVAVLITAALLLGMLNAVVRAVLPIVRTPSIWLFFVFLIASGLMLLWLPRVVSGFHVDNFSSGVWTAILISTVSWILSKFFPGRNARATVLASLVGTLAIGTWLTHESMANKPGGPLEAPIQSQESNVAVAASSPLATAVHDAKPNPGTSTNISPAAEASGRETLPASTPRTTKLFAGTWKGTRHSYSVCPDFWQGRAYFDTLDMVEVSEDETRVILRKGIPRNRGDKPGSVRHCSASKNGRTMSWDYIYEEGKNRTLVSCNLTLDTEEKTATLTISDKNLAGNSCYSEGSGIVRKIN